MQESYGEDLASHTDPESCAVVRKGAREALTGARAGGLLSREIRSCIPTLRIIVLPRQPGKIPWLILDSRVVIGQFWRKTLFLQALHDGRDWCGIFEKSRLILSV